LKGYSLILPNQENKKMNSRRKICKYLNMKFTGILLLERRILWILVASLKFSPVTYLLLTDKGIWLFFIFFELG
jgi:hypothetical protein